MMPRLWAFGGMLAQVCKACSHSYSVYSVFLYCVHSEPLMVNTLSHTVVTHRITDNIIRDVQIEILFVH